MQAPRFATISFSLDTEKHRRVRPDVRKDNLSYLIDRLFTGEPVAESEFAYYGIRVTIRDAVTPEIIKGED